MAIGTVKWFNPKKGYGFIQPEDDSKDVFVHISEVERSGIGNLREGQKLTFDIERGQQGETSAVNLEAVCDPATDRSPHLARQRSGRTGEFRCKPSQVGYISRMTTDSARERTYRGKALEEDAGQRRSRRV